MRKFMLAIALALTAAVSAQAQQVRNPPYRTTSQDTLHDALRDPDPIHRDERLIAGANKRINGNETPTNPTPGFYYRAPTFEARVVVANTSAKKIRTVSWTATLTDPGTGALIRTFDVRTKANIAPGRTKELKKMLPTPNARVVGASARRRNPRPAADLNVAVTSVTYVDGSTSKTP